MCFKSHLLQHLIFMYIISITTHVYIKNQILSAASSAPSQQKHYFSTINS